MLNQASLAHTAITVCMFMAFPASEVLCLSDNSILVSVLIKETP